MNENTLKQEFIKYFGEEEWQEQEILKIYQDMVNYLIKEYLGINSIPVIFESLDCDVARYDIRLEVIILNRKYKNNNQELINSILHELRHHYQMCYIKTQDTLKTKRWMHVLRNYNSNITNELEIDAYAFAKVVGYLEFGFIYNTGNFELEKRIDKYIANKKLIINV